MSTPPTKKRLNNAISPEEPAKKRRGAETLNNIIFDDMISMVDEDEHNKYARILNAMQDVVGKSNDNKMGEYGEEQPNEFHVFNNNDIHVLKDIFEKLHQKDKKSIFQLFQKEQNDHTREKERTHSQQSYGGKSRRRRVRRRKTNKKRTRKLKRMVKKTNKKKRKSKTRARITGN